MLMANRMGEVIIQINEATVTMTQA